MNWLLLFCVGYLLVALALAVLFFNADDQDEED